MTTQRPERSTPAYRAWVKHVLTHCEPTCIRCGYPVDMTLPPTHPEGPTADHEPPLSVTGEATPSLDGAGISHLHCNRSHGGRLGAAQTNRQRNQPNTPPHPRHQQKNNAPRTKKNETQFLKRAQKPPAPPLSVSPQDGPKRAKAAKVAPVLHRDGFVLPRLETAPVGSERGTVGADARAWLASAFGMQLRPWQAYALDRALEVDDAGRLVWSTVIVTVARQSGKSWLSRAMCMWRLHHAEMFGEEQTVLHVANRRSTAMEVMRPAAMWAVEQYGKKAVRWGNEQTGIHLPTGDRWLIHAANESAGVGYSCSLTFVDEAWKIPRTVVEDALAPTMAEREQPQLWLVSTAGDSTSDLMQAYRQAALDQAPGVLLLEWSAPPEANPDDVDTWRWASPEWTPKRAEFLTRQHANIDPQAWRKEYLNQWVTRSGHWLKEAWWTETFDSAVQLPTGGTWSVAIESEFDGMGHAVAIAAADDDGVVVLRVTTHRTLADVDAKLREIRAQHHAVHVAATPGYVDRLREPFDALVGNREAAAATQNLLDLFDRRQLRHDGATVLAEHLAASTISRRQGGWTISAPQGRGGVYAARAVMFAASQAAKTPKPRPVIVTRRRAG